MNPTTARITSPDHNALYANGVPKILDYRVIAVATNDSGATPLGEQVIPKGSAVPVVGDEYDLTVTTLMNGLPAEQAGFIFARAEGPEGNGSYFNGQAFFRGALPAPVSVTALL